MSCWLKDGRNNSFFVMVAFKYERTETKRRRQRRLQIYGMCYALLSDLEDRLKEQQKDEDEITIARSILDELIEETEEEDYPTSSSSSSPSKRSV